MSKQQKAHIKELERRLAEAREANARINALNRDLNRECSRLRAERDRSLAETVTEAVRDRWHTLIDLAGFGPIGGR